VQKASSLSGGSFVENRGHSPNKRIIETRHPHSNALFLSFPDLVSGFSFNLFLPPKRVALNRKRRDRIPFHLIGIPWFCVLQTLPETEDVSSIIGVVQYSDYPCWVTYILIPIALKAGDSDEVASYRISLPIYFSTVHAHSFPVDNTLLYLKLQLRW